MSGLGNAVVIVAVIGLVIARQMRPRRIRAGGRWWLLPAVLVVLAVRDGGVVDSAHRSTSIGMLAAELAVAVVMGFGWAFTTRMWTEGDGSVWTQGTKAALGVWVVGIAVRVALYGIAAAMGVHQHSGSVLLAVAATLLIRSGVLMARAQHAGGVKRAIT
ncbi:DUF1453 domain-containing protein [Actinacidiphila sp. DG2A-62]|jgi:hypothetical protein|uniref:DUF1453 domain-containing protein n=1 Tax=Actinacidiphila sp. DG2A-62 TaxID=3108821 RepID=UPI002DC03919|nr:DUF1453 domain-containing protein [Actinacidiphila sp. DG2A-62]MEC3997587.1 DUF1453 domain-containing protein [Actinacidiphila sp. DG2A-62]